MTTSSEFDSIKNILETTLHSYNYSKPLTKLHRNFVHKEHQKLTIFLI